MSFKCNYNIHLFEANFPVLFYIGYFQGLSSAYRRKPRGKFILRKNKDMTISQKNTVLETLVCKKGPEGFLMSIYWLDMLKNISLTFSQPMRRGKA